MHTALQTRWGEPFDPKGRMVDRDRIELREWRGPVGGDVQARTGATHYLKLHVAGSGEPALGAVLTGPVAIEELGKRLPLGCWGLR